ncbi:MJ0042-type zinc finger domain-containing protein [Candidatus Pantoea formicae]
MTARLVRCARCPTRWYL